MKLPLFFGLIFFFALPIICANADVKPFRPAPEIVCVENEFFFGAVSNTETIIHEFAISNEGVAPLNIATVRTDCGCVLASPRKNELEPGESTALKVNFDLKGRSGSQFRRITIKSNDPQQPLFTLALIGVALAPLEIIPERIYWGNLRAAAVVEKSCDIKFSEGEQSYITAAVAPTNVFAAEVITIIPRRHYRIKIRSGPPAAAGSFQLPLRLLTDHPRFRTIEIPMQGRWVGDIYAIPEAIPVPRAGGPGNRALLVYSGLTEKFKITGLELPRPEMEAGIHPMRTANGYRIDLRNITPADGLNGKNIVILTDCATMPELRVPFCRPDPGQP